MLLNNIAFSLVQIPVVHAKATYENKPLISL